MAELTVKDLMTKEIMYVDFYDKVIKVAHFMYEKGIGSIIIKRGGASEGIMTERDIVHNCVMGSKNIFNTAVGEIMTEPIMCISGETTIFDACQSLVKKNIKKLMVLDDQDKIGGIITMTDIINNLDRLFQTDETKKVTEILISEIMTKNLFYSDIEDNAMDITTLMKRNNVGSIIIMDRGVPAGIITERDIVKNCVIGEKNFILLKAKDIMSGPVITLPEDKTVKEAAQIMKDKNIKKIVVAGAEENIAGIITQTDIIYNIDLLWESINKA